MNKWIKHIVKWSLIVGILLPFVFLLFLSLVRQWGFPQLWPNDWTLQHWQRLVLGDGELLSSFFFSLLLSLSVAFVTTISGFLMAKKIAYHPRKSMLLMLAYFPYLISPVVYAACLYFYFTQWNLSGQWLGVFIAQLIITFPFSLILFVGYWNHRLKAMEELVLTMGGSRQQAFWKVLLPVSKNILLLGFFQCFLISWMEYGLTQLIGVGLVQTMTIRVYSYVTEANPYLAALASCLLVIPPLVLLWVNKRVLFRR